MKNELLLRKEIYKEKYIDQAILAYKDICTINKLEELEYYVCRFTHSVIDVEQVIREFEDFLIGITGKNDY